MPLASSPPRSCVPSLLLLALLVVSGCGASGPLMAPEAEPLAPDALVSVRGLVPYLSAYGINVVRVAVDPSPSDPLIEDVYVLDLGVEGRCSVQTFYTAQGARQFGARSANEVRDLRRPIETDLLRGPAPRGRPGVANNPTFLFGRHVALCGRGATARRAFKALELYAEDLETESDGDA